MAGKTKKTKAKPKTVKAVIKNMAKRGKVSGKGDFFSDAWSGVKNFTKKILGQGIHKGVDWLSNRAHDTIKGIVGHGDYQLPGAPVTYNSMYAGASVTPKFENKGNGNIIQHRESLGVIKSSNAFQRTSLTMNPGLTLFPWVSEIAGAWQRYKFHGAIIEWIPAVSPLSTNAGGRVVLSSRYDLTTTAPSSIQEAEVTFGATVGRPMDQMAMPIECKTSMNAVNALNVRFGDLPVGANAQFFDHCIVDVCNSGQTDGSSDAGEVFITYEIEFLMPIAEHLTNASVQSFCAYTATTALLPAGPAGSTGFTKRPGNNLPIVLTASATTLQIDFDGLQPLPVGSTWVVSVQQAATTSAANPTVTLGSDLSSYRIYKANGGTDGGEFGSGTGQYTSNDVAFQVSSATTNQSIIYSGLTVVGTGFMTVVVTPIVSGLAEIKMRSRYPGIFTLQDSIKGQLGVIASRVEDDEKSATLTRDEMKQFRSWMAERQAEHKFLSRAVESDDEHFAVARSTKQTIG